MEKEQNPLEEKVTSVKKEEPVQEEPVQEEPVQEEVAEKFKETTEKIWDNTKRTWITATFRATQYKNLVQKKIDLSNVQKKINSTHADLGKQIDVLRTAGKKNIMNQGEIKEILARLDEDKREALALEEEIKRIKSEEPNLTEESGEEESSETKTP